ncbi:hypothetical protein [Xanthomonas sp. A1809]|uniref:hypothetical protein n=1 Tax=Xanthomonas sp. A1809 TaxID=2821275 RepID=UPI001AD9942A|nr:hypothetical protein [Xanthomonas sp. A1809]MBO9858605.1 hypothetical protein [Xanthomonas sp. A1809]
MYKGTRSIFKRYWRAYGGSSALRKSPYLHLALLLVAITYHYWSNEAWWDQPLAILPNLLGFSLGGMAMLLSFGNHEFQKILSEREQDSERPTVYLEISATFIHFMLMQLAAILIAITFKSLDFYFPWPAQLVHTVQIAKLSFSALGYLLFIYSITCMVSAIFAVFRMTSWFETFQNPPKP